MKSIIITCAVAAGACLCAGAQPLGVTLHPEGCAPVATADGPGNLFPTPGHDRMATLGQSARRQALRKADGAGTWNFKNFEGYQKVGDEWVLVRSETREIDPVTGYVLRESSKLVSGEYPDNLQTLCQLVEYEYDEYGRTILRTTSQGDTPEAMTPVQRDVTEYFEDAGGSASYVKCSYSQYAYDGGATWVDLPNSRTDVERDAEGRVTRVTMYYYMYDSDGVRAPYMDSDASIVYGADNRPAEATVLTSDGYTRVISDMEWVNFDPADIYGISWLNHTWPATGNSRCSHVVFTTSHDGQPTRIFSSDMTVDGATSRVDYTRVLESDETPTGWGEVKEGTAVRHDFTGANYNIYRSELSFVPGEDWYRYWEQVDGSTFLPVVNFRIDSRSIYLTEENIDGSPTYYGTYTAAASHLTYHEDSGMVHEYVTPGETCRGRVDIVGLGLPWYVDQQLEEWPKLYDDFSDLDTTTPFKRVYTNWVKATDAIDAVEVDNSAFPVEWFTVDGCRVANPSGGIFIRRQGTQATKVLLK